MQYYSGSQSAKPLLLVCSLIFLIALVIPGATAVAKITAIEYEGTGLVKVGTQYFIIPDTVVDGVLRFTVDEDTTALVIDIAGLDQRLTDSLANTISTNRCEENVCSIPVEFFAKKGSTKKLSWTWADVGGRANTVTSTIGFDTVAPKLDTIGTGTCKVDCAVKSGSNVIVAYFTEAGLGMNPATTKLITPDGTVSATSCERVSCKFNVELTTGAEGDVEFSIDPVSTDRAGNKVTGADKKFNLVVDNVKPRILGITVKQGSSVVPIITGPFTVAIKVSDESAVTGFIDARDVTGSAEKVELKCANGTCQAELKPKLAQGAKTVSISIVDAAGNTESAERTVSIARLVDGTPGTYSTTVKMSPDTIDVNAASLFTTKTFMEVSLIPEEGGEVAFVRATKCGFKVGTQNAPLALQQTAPTIFGASTDTPVLALNIKPIGTNLDARSGTLIITCELEVRSYSNGELLKNATKVNATGRLQIISNPLAPAKVKVLQKEAAERQLKIDKAIGGINKAYSAGRTFCELYQTGHQVQSVLGGVTSTFAGIGNFWAPAKIVARGAEQGGKAIAKPMAKLEKANNGKKFCNMLTCSAPGLANEQISDFMTFGLDGNNNKGRSDKIAKFMTGDNNGNSNAFLDPYKSLPIALTQACVPAVMHHLNTWRSIECSYSQCIQKDVPTGVPVTVCRQERQFQLCTKVTGSVFYITPFGALQMLRDRVVKYLSDPVLQGSLIIYESCFKLSEGNEAAMVASGSCRLYRGIKNANNYAQSVSGIVQAAKAFQSPKDCTVSTAFEDPYFNQADPEAYCTSSFCTSGPYVGYPASTTTGFESGGKDQEDIPIVEIKTQYAVIVPQSGSPSNNANQVKAAGGSLLDRDEQKRVAATITDPKVRAEFEKGTIAFMKVDEKVVAADHRENIARGVSQIAANTELFKDSNAMKDIQDKIDTNRAEIAKLKAPQATPDIKLPDPKTIAISDSVVGSTQPVINTRGFPVFAVPKPEEVKVPDVKSQNPVIDHLAEVKNSLPRGKTGDINQVSKLVPSTLSYGMGPVESIRYIDNTNGGMMTQYDAVVIYKSGDVIALSGEVIDNKWVIKSTIGEAKGSSAVIKELTLTGEIGSKIAIGESKFTRSGSTERKVGESQPDPTKKETPPPAVKTADTPAQQKAAMEAWIDINIRDASLKKEMLTDIKTESLKTNPNYVSLSTTLKTKADNYIATSAVTKNGIPAPPVPGASDQVVNTQMELVEWAKKQGITSDELYAAFADNGANQENIANGDPAGVKAAMYEAAKTLAAKQAVRKELLQGTWTLARAEQANKEEAQKYVKNVAEAKVKLYADDLVKFRPDLDEAAKTILVADYQKKVNEIMAADTSATQKDLSLTAAAKEFEEKNIKPQRDAALKERQAQDLKNEREKREVADYIKRSRKGSGEKFIDSLGFGLQTSSTVSMLSNFGFAKGLRGATTWPWEEDLTVGGDWAQKFSEEVCLGTSARRSPESLTINTNGQVGLTFNAVRVTSVEQRIVDALNELSKLDEELGVSVPPAELTEVPKFRYIISGRIATMPLEDESEEPITYALTLDGSEGRSNRLAENSLQPGATVSWSGASRIKLESTTRYDRVCVEFSVPIKTLYPRSEIDGNEACLPIGDN